METLGKADLSATPLDFGYTEEHGAARDAARRFLSERSTMTEVRRLAEDPRGFSPEVHREMAGLGWLGLTTPEHLGGLELDHLHLALLLDEMGRALLPSPYLGSLLALRAIETAGDAGQQGSLGPRITSGEAVATVALTEPSASWEPDAVQTQAEPAGGGYRLSGIKTHVLFGAEAQLVIVPAKLPAGELSLFSVELPASGVSVSGEVSIDPTRRLARMTLDGVRVGSQARLSGDGGSALSAVHELGWMALACEMTGVLEATLELTRRYAVDRIQFGKPIGAFQAVKHPIVDMMVGCELSRSLSYGAAVSFDHARQRASLLSRMAKAYVGDQLEAAVRKAVQLHGGFGFTWDCDAHFFFKRALYARSTLGDGIHHRRHLASSLFDGSSLEVMTQRDMGI